MNHAVKLGGFSAPLRLGGVLLMLLGGCLSMTANAETIYRWVGSNGVTSYGETPPAGARGVEQIAGAPQQSVSTPANTTSTQTSIAPVRPSAPRPEASKVNPVQQRLQAELVAARLQLLQATHNYQQGKAIRTGNERNYARYLDRINGLRQEMDSAKLRVMLLQHQLEQTSQEATPASASVNPAH